MKKIFTLLSVAAVALSVSAETVILSNPGKAKENVLSGTQLGENVPAGFSLQCMNESKKLESGSSFNIDGTNYVSIKCSNGAQNTLTLPEGYVATKLTIYTTINKDAATTRACYWKEVAGTQYSEDANNGIIESFKDFKNPNIQSFDIPDLNVVTFTNTGEQPFIVLEVTYEEKVNDPIAEANQAAYEAVIAQLDALQEKYDEAVAHIKEINPEFDFSMYEEIPQMIEQYRGWAAQAVASANEEGEAFMFPFDGSEIENFISMMLMEAEPAPEFPTSLNVTLSNNEGVELTVDDSQGVFLIEVTGKSSEEELTITVAVPEGFDGFVSIRDIDMDFGIGNDPLSTRAEEAEWWPIDVLLEQGFKEANTMTFPVDGYHSGMFLLCKNGCADMNNNINVEFDVEYDETSGVSGVNAAENATYYDLQGNRIAKPETAKGIYVKVAEGKASKIIVK